MEKLLYKLKSLEERLEIIILEKTSSKYVSIYEDEIKKLKILIDKKSKESFKEQLINDFIPRMEEMATKELEHLHYLIDIDAPTDFVQTSQKTHYHFLKRLSEYNEYVKHLN